MKSIFAAIALIVYAVPAFAELQRLDIGRDESPADVKPVILTPIRPLSNEKLHLEPARHNDREPDQKAAGKIPAEIAEPIRLEVRLEEVADKTPGKTKSQAKTRKYIGAIVPKGAKVKSAPSGKKVSKPVAKMEPEVKPSPTEGKTVKTEMSQPADQAAVERAVNEATQTAAAAKKKLAGTVYAFRDNAIYNVHARIGNITTVILQPGENIVNVAAGDTERWMVEESASGEGEKRRTHILLKPMEDNLETNFIITTSKRFYTLNVKTSKTFFQPIISWTYPQEERLIALRAKEEHDRLEAQVTAANLTPETLNFNYTMKGDKAPWQPYRVFDDGQKTYIQMSDKMKVAEAPVFFVKTGNNLDLVNYRVVNDYYIIDRLFAEGVLQNGDESIVITNKTMKRGWFN